MTIHKRPAALGIAIAMVLRSEEHTLNSSHTEIYTLSLHDALPIFTPMAIGGFAAMRALSTRNDNPQAASRPWDRDRDGFEIGRAHSELQSHRDLHSFPTRRSSDLHTHGHWRIRGHARLEHAE